MKRNLMVIVFIVLILVGCKKNDEIVIGDSMSNINNKNNQYIFLNSLSVFETDSIYTVVVGQNGIVQKVVEFSADRKSHNVQGLTLVKSEDISQYLNMSLSDLKDKWGEVHADIGSGFYIPAYITEDGYLICFELEDEIVFGVTKRDILNNTIVDKVSSVFE